MRAPRCEAIDRDQLGDHLRIRQLVEAIEVELATRDVLSERAQEADLGVRRPQIERAAVVESC